MTLDSDRLKRRQGRTDRGVARSPLSDSRRFLSGLCSSQLVKAAGARERKRDLKNGEGKITEKNRMGEGQRMKRRGWMCRGRVKPLWKWQAWHSVRFAGWQRGFSVWSQSGHQPQRANIIPAAPFQLIKNKNPEPSCPFSHTCPPTALHHFYFLIHLFLISLMCSLSIDALFLC